MGEAQELWSREINVPGNDKKYEATYINMGNPHCVLIVDEHETQHGEVERYGSKLSKATEYFPEGANIEFITLQGKDKLRMKVWERGVGRTLACGTGACASAYAAHKKGLVGDHVHVELDGGEVEVQIEGNNVKLIGPATFVYRGQYLYVYEPLPEEDE